LTAQTSSVVAALGEAIAKRIGEPRYKLWFEGHTCFRWDGDVLNVGVPNRHFEEWLQKTFLGAVRESAVEVFGAPMQVRFTIDPELFRAARQEQAERGARSAEREAKSTEDEDVKLEAVAKEEEEEEEEARPAPTRERKKRTDREEGATLFDATVRRPRKTWKKLDEFVVGSCNRVAHAAAMSVIEMATETASPLVIHGSVGTGKTHLLEGIYVGLRRAHPEWRVIFETTEGFTNRFVQAMRLNKLGGLRKHFRECDALLLDDIDFLATKKATKEEFLHTLDTLLSDGKVVVLTSDCHPRLSEDFPPELVDRLLGGAVWGLTPPDADTRLNLLRAKVGKAGEVLIAEEVLKYLASQLRGNVRELEGALNSLRHFSRVTGRPIDVNLAREALAELLRHAVRVVQLGDIDAAVCKVLRLPVGALQQKQRAWAVSHPRMVAMYLARKHTSSAYSEIGQHFGGRNHSTAVAAEKKVRQWVESNGEMNLGERTFRVRDVIELVEREVLR
jgi:chromosomal replication initiator protein